MFVCMAGVTSFVCVLPMLSNLFSLLPPKLILLLTWFVLFTHTHTYTHIHTHIHTYTHIHTHTHTYTHIHTYTHTYTHIHTHTHTYTHTHTAQLFLVSLFFLSPSHSSFLLTGRQIQRLGLHF